MGVEKGTAWRQTGEGLRGPTLITPSSPMVCDGCRRTGTLRTQDGVFHFCDRCIKSGEYGDPSCPWGWSEADKAPEAQEIEKESPVVQHGTLSQRASAFIAEHCPVFTPVKRAGINSVTPPKRSESEPEPIEPKTQTEEKPMPRGVYERKPRSPEHQAKIIESKRRNLEAQKALTENQSRPPAKTETKPAKPQGRERITIGGEVPGGAVTVDELFVAMEIFRRLKPEQRRTVVGLLES